MEKGKYGKDWELYDHEYGYDKQEYDIQTSTGETYFNCYPNAGVFIPVGGPAKYKHIPEELVFSIRLSENEVLGINY